jgi:hypothetical protein
MRDDCEAGMSPDPGTELVVRESASPANFGEMMQLAQHLVTTGFLPVAVKTPAQAVAIILTGKELGLGPMQSLRSIYIVQGKPALAADLQLALFKRAGGKSVFKELTTEKAVLWLKHPNGDEHTETFTMQDAQAARVAGKDTWKQFPKAMLRSRVITAGLKSVGFEPTTGVYDPEELGAEVVPDEAARGVEVEAPSGGSPPAASAPAGVTSDGEIILIPGDAKSFGGYGGQRPVDIPTETLKLLAKTIAKRYPTEHANVVDAINDELEQRRSSGEAEQHTSGSHAPVRGTATPSPTVGSASPTPATSDKDVRRDPTPLPKAISEADEVDALTASIERELRSAKALKVGEGGIAEGKLALIEQRYRSLDPDAGPAAYEAILGTIEKAKGKAIEAIHERFAEVRNANLAALKKDMEL